MVKLIPLPVVCDMTGLQKSAIYERISNGTFPGPVKISRASRWAIAEVKHGSKKPWRCAMQNKKRLRTFKDSPALEYFSHWLSDDGQIDAIDARTYFKLAPDGFGWWGMKEVAVTFFPLRKMRELKYYDHPLHNEQWAVYRGQYPYSQSGNHFDEWMQDGNVMPPANLIEDTGSRLGYSPDADF